MGVQRLPSPRLVSDSMSSGGEPHEAFSMGAPGSPGIAPAPQAFETLDLGAVGTESSPDATDRRRVAASGAMAPDKDTPTPQGGQFAQADREDSNAALWKPTASSL